MMTVKTSGEILATSVEVFRTPTSRARGLLKFDEAPQNYAGIFVLPLGGFLPVIHTFGMKFPIDIAFLSPEGEVVKFFSRVGPGRLVAPLKKLFGGCHYVVEFSDARLAKISEGDVLEWRESA